MSTENAAGNKRFRIKDKVYEFATANDITLRDLLLVEKETREMGRTLHMGEVVRLGELFQKLSQDEARTHEEAGWMLAVTIWMSMVKDLRDHGDYTTQVPFAQAIDFKFTEFSPIQDPADHQAAAKPDPQKRAPRKGSGQAAKPAPKA